MVTYSNFLYNYAFYRILNWILCPSPSPKDSTVQPSFHQVPPETALQILPQLSSAFCRLRDIDVGHPLHAQLAQLEAECWEKVEDEEEGGGTDFGLFKYLCIKVDEFGKYVM